MKLLSVLTYPDARLRRTNNTAKPSNDLLSDLTYTMYGHGGIGLAAPQVGIPVKAFVLDTHLINKADNSLSFSNRETELFCNPEIISFSKEEVDMEEGCLSFPGTSAKIIRPVSVEIRATLVDGNEVQTQLQGLAGRAFQHELDHVNGILMVDRVSGRVKKRIFKDMRRYKSR